MEKIFEHILKIEKIHIENFRLFENLEVDLHPELTVFISENGAGKTTILDAIAGHLYYLTDLIKKNVIGTSLPQQTKNYFPNYIDDLNVATKPSLLKLLFRAIYFDAKSEEEIWETGEKLQSMFEFYSSEKYSYNSNVNLNKEIKLTDELYNSIGLIYNTGKLLSIPILAFYPCGFANPKFEEKKIRPFNIFSAWEDALDDATYDFGDFSNWYKHLLVKEKFTNVVSGLQETIKNAILSMLNDDSNNNFSDFTLDVNSYPEQLVILKCSKQLKYNQLSSGEKHLLVLTADIARRLYIANPHLENPLNGQGIVLIDEIDLHLHPRWQRKVITQLRKTFPNIQFVVTTHSPLVLGNVESKHIRILSDGEIKFASKSFGQDISTIIELLMNVDSGQFKSEIKKIHSLISDGHFEEAESSITLIKMKLDGSLPQLSEVEAILKRKKLLMK